MVVGHATGMFNAFIYQFHMAAFFFISGFTSKSGRGVLNVLIRKFYSLVVPLITTFFIGIFSNFILNKMGIYGRVFGNFPYIGAKASIFEFFARGNLYVQWLGAGWFLTTLFGVYVLLEGLYKLTAAKSSYPYYLSSLLLMAAGFYMVTNGVQVSLGFILADLVCIAQAYVCLGQFVRREVCPFLEKHSKQRKGILAVSIAASAAISIWGLKNGAVMDMVSRSFGRIYPQLIVSCADFILVYALAILIMRLPKKISEAASFLGRSTLPIVLFHFLIFKLLGIVIVSISKTYTLDNIYNVVPDSMISNYFWPAYLIVSIAGSLCIWNFIGKFKFAKILFGEERSLADALIEKTEKVRFVNKLLPDNETIQPIQNLGFKDRWNEAIHNETLKPYLLVGCALVLTICIPIYKQGIICNDELQTRDFAMGGVETFAAYVFDMVKTHGRAMYGPTWTITMLAGFIQPQNILIFRASQTICIFIDVYLYYRLMSQITADKKLSLMAVIIFASTLPVLFEHTLPNAFNTQYGIPVALLLISLRLFWQYLNIDESKIHNLTVSTVLYFAVLCCYEAFVTYIIIFYYMILSREHKFANACKKALAPTIAVFIFLIFYLISRTLYPTTYSGNDVSINLPVALNVIGILLINSFPGRWILSNKYHYFEQLYYSMNPGEFIRLLVFTVSLLIVLIGIYYGRRHDANARRANNYIPRLLLGFAIAAVLPLIPVSLAGMYQIYVPQGEFGALPVTYFSYFATVGMVSLFLNWIIQVMPSKAVKGVVIALVCVLCVRIQVMNGVIANRQYADYERLTTIESILSSQYVNDGVMHTVSSTDIFATRDLLAIHDGYWDQFAAINGLSLSIKNDADSNADVRIYELPNNVFEIDRNDGETIIASNRYIDELRSYCDDAYTPYTYLGRYKNTYFYSAS